MRHGFEKYILQQTTYSSPNLLNLFNVSITKDPNWKSENKFELCFRERNQG